MFTFTVNGEEAMETIASVIETARANNADPYYHLNGLIDQIPKSPYDNEKEHMVDLIPWSDAYRKHESIEYGNMVGAKASPCNERSRTSIKE